MAGKITVAALAMVGAVYYAAHVQPGLEYCDVGTEFRESIIDAYDAGMMIGIEPPYNHKTAWVEYVYTIGDTEAARSVSDRIDDNCRQGVIWPRWMLDY